MGGGPVYRPTPEEVARSAAAEAAYVAQFDCKDFAIQYAAKTRGLSVRRGYILFPEGFTEHWWCAESRKGSDLVVDVTGFCGAGGEYIPLNKRDLSTFFSTCDAMTGPCDSPDGSIPCPWCEKRLELEGTGKQRARLKDPGSLRRLFDRLMHATTVLRRQLEEEKDHALRVEQALSKMRMKYER